MKILKGILIVVLGLVALFLIVGLFLPSEFHFERSTIVNAPDSVVYEYLTDFNKRPEWDPWLEMEPTAKNSFEQVEGKVGSKYTWEGVELGKGILVIEEVVQNKSIKCKMEFIEPYQSIATVLWDLESTDGGTKATWAIEGELSYPMERYMGLMMDGMMGPQFEKGLTNVKKNVESNWEKAVSDTTASILF